MSKIKAAILPVSSVLDKALSLQRGKSETKVKPYVEQTDEELIKAVQQGDEQAFSHVVQRYQGKLFAYIMRLMNHRDEAHDITQDVFLKAYKNIHRFDTDRKFSSWIYRIAHNESVNWLKKKTRAKVESLESHVENGFQLAGSTDVHEQLVSKEAQKLVREAIQTLPNKYQEVMEMRYLDQLSYDEISKKLDKPVNTVGTLINRAKKKLALELEAT
jgi:RNA polymerase sigma-70 factor (ECF subfamily)